MATQHWREILFNALRFEAGWLLCVLGGSWVAAFAGTGLLGWHIWRCAKPGEWRFIGVFAVLGLAIDGGLHLVGGFDFGGHALAVGLLPLWLWMLWPLFATLVFHSLAWLWRYPLIAAACGAVSGPLSYLGGAALADVGLAPWLLPTQAAIWAVLCFGISRYAMRLKRTASLSIR
ncbi:DUF2878 domain-containing protein [Vreelandella nigrificans]|uniref:DUF2878 domain-containing protein n=1 Tax=Vreelandella nigrificans TaxID=2042704 RepID=A0A2A4HP77_9GAMM|nr:DUF2878 domain-containing protein [Halomonas nigrificans]PCF96712.1 hypothetical protein CPA45_06785 [Halomonas nigrificans]